MKAIKLTDKVYWVGAVDWNIRDFHGYSTNRGTTYNAYLVLGEKPALIDVVKKEFYEEMMSRIRSVIDPEKIKIIVSNHAEMDHTGALPMAAAVIKPEEVYASELGLKNIDLQLHDKNIKIKIVKTGDKIDLGGDTLSFTESRMLHWPDSMVSFLEGEGILFSNDIFGMHFASGERFDDELEEKEWAYEAKKYYANIITPYSDIAVKFLNMVEESGFLSKVKIIAPDHGLIWRKNPGRMVELYKLWASQKPSKKAVIVYDSMWGSTDKMAKSVADGLVQEGIEVKMMFLHSAHRSDVATEMLNAGAVILGSPVMNNFIFPSLGDALFYLRGLKFKNLLGASFGSYGWSSAALDNLTKELEIIKADVVSPTVKAIFVPEETDLNACVELGRLVGQKLKEKIK
ncbi:Flavorubredoxin [Parelusimicrobium proximum]|uniref:FprA family A-type flavoprotein n=1 Tax=Parelusimicrobium proximum TaxID=3228953 RepID=UPI003D17E314